MQYILSVAALAGVALAQMSDISAGGPAPGCSPTDPNTFQIQTVNVTSSKLKRQAPGDPSAGAGPLIISLNDGKLTDAQGRTGYIADNRQFQFDFANGQAGTVFNDGFSVCPNGTLALGQSAIFYQCLSGDFYNLYDQSTGAQCSPIYIVTIPSGTNTGAVAPSSSVAPVSTSSAAPATSSVAAPPAVSPSPVPSQIPDGQVQAPPAASQIPDGQVQAPNATYSAPTPQYTGAAAALAPGMGALAAGAIALALL